MRHRRWIMAMAATVAATAAATATGTNLWSNLWLATTDREYRVPAESSVWWFAPTVMNAGSGGWWLYGEDRERYYHFTGQGAQPFRAISREAARTCRGFDPKQVPTWCG